MKSPFINHFRHISPSEVSESNPKGIKPKGGLTIAVLRTDEGLCRWGFSKCRYDDSFNKSLGRVRAVGRATSKKALISNGMNDAEILEKSNEVGKFIMINRVMPDEQKMFESILNMGILAD